MVISATGPEHRRRQKEKRHHRRGQLRDYEGVEVQRALNDLCGPVFALDSDRTRAGVGGGNGARAGVGKRPRQRQHVQRAGADGQRRRRRFKRGTVALREIRRFQNTHELLIRKAPFGRLLREVCNGICKERQKDPNYKAKDCPFRFQSTAVLASQEAAEAGLVTTMDSANLAAIHSKRVTLMPKDMQLVKRIHESGSGICNTGFGGL